MLIEYFLGFSIFAYIGENEKTLSFILGIIAFLAVCIYGITKPHRSFMHSFTALFILTIIVDFIFHDAALPFAIGILSHILLDLLNMKKVQLFYPFKKRFGFKLCSANGMVNMVLFITCISIFILEIMIFTANLLS